LVALTPDAGSPHKQYQEAPLPLRALYILEPRDPARNETAIERLPHAAALHQALVFRWSRVPITSEHAAAELGALARLTQTIPVCRVRRPDGIDTLEQVVRAIRADVISHAE
jgi:hypothetical protein